MFQFVVMIAMAVGGIVGLVKAKKVGEWLRPKYPTGTQVPLALVAMPCVGALLLAFGGMYVTKGTTLALASLAGGLVWFVYACKRSIEGYLGRPVRFDWGKQDRD
jgi:hypothetical protein